jgi:uncharacterized protein (PEP-CTERM system associated)
MLARPRRSLLRQGAALAALAVSLLAAPQSRAQEPSVVAANDTSPAAAGSTLTAAPAGRAPGEPGASNFTDSLIPGFEWAARIDLGETYATNATGLSTGGRSDWLTFGGLGIDLHEHSRRVSLDLTYAGNVNYYAKGSQNTQFTNNLLAVGNVIAIPEYLNFTASAFAQPVVLSNLGSVTANGTVSPNGYSNSYGYSVGPRVTFELGDFARSETVATYSAAYFTNPSGAFPFPVIPGVPGPQNTTTRTISETLSSGPDFSRLNWSLAGVFNETDRPQGLFSEKAGVGTFEYAITREIALLATGGYDAISNTRPLTKDLTGPVAMGGFALTLGEDFSLRVQGGQKYNSGSFIGTLLWNIGPTSAITGSATDSVSTPEGQLLNNLTSLTASRNGTLTSSSDIYANGSASSLGAFSIQPQGSQSFTQTIARYQQVNLDFSQDFERYHFLVGAFGSRMTQLEAVFLGPPVTNSWGGRATVSHDITRDLSGTIGGSYTNDQELGGTAKTFAVDGQIAYTLSPDTQAYFRADYLTRDSSRSLQTLSPFTGNLDDLRFTIGFSHTL